MLLHRCIPNCKKHLIFSFVPNLQYVHMFNNFCFSIVSGSKYGSTYSVNRRVTYNLLMTLIESLAQAGVELGRRGIAHCSALWVRHFEIMSTKDCTQLDADAVRNSEYFPISQIRRRTGRNEPKLT